MFSSLNSLFKKSQNDPKIPNAKNCTEPEKSSLGDTQNALNNIATRHGFRCVPVSWEDAQRGTVGGALSCWGSNISDVRLWAKDGTLLYTLRSENWNERLGYVSSKDVAVIEGNHVPGGAPYTPCTLRNYLKHFKEYASYVGATSDQLFDDVADQILSIRFQAVFLPIASEETSEFCTEVYNYNAHSDDNPRNIVLLCTAQGTHVQQDGAGAKKMFLHSVDRKGCVHRYWMEAERSRHRVGGAQHETEAESAAAAARGKATALHIGTKEMGTRFNVQMLIQLPIQQQRQKSATNDETNKIDLFDKENKWKDLASNSCEPTVVPAPESVTTQNFDPSVFDLSCVVNNEIEETKSVIIQNLSDILERGEKLESLEAKSEDLAMHAHKFHAYKFRRRPWYSRMASSIFSFFETKTPTFTYTPTPPKKPLKRGTCNAARVSRGTEYDSTWAGLNNKMPILDASQHGTITVTLYYTCADGVPSPEDVEACVADLNAFYKACLRINDWWTVKKSQPNLP